MIVNSHLKLEGSKRKMIQIFFFVVGFCPITKHLFWYLTMCYEGRVGVFGCKDHSSCSNTGSFRRRGVGIREAFACSGGTRKYDGGKNTKALSKTPESIRKRKKILRKIIFSSLIFL